MPTINITRGADATVLYRRDVETGLVFAVKNVNTGQLGTQYASIGVNGRAYSVRVDTGELSSSSGDSPVTLIGTWSFTPVNREFNLYAPSRVGREVKRSEVASGEVFQVKGGTKEYVHIGRITRDRLGWLSVPLLNQENHAVTENGESTVTIVGTTEMDVVLTK